jgi:Flp pilus assembly protein TadD
MPRLPHLSFFLTLWLLPQQVLLAQQAPTYDKVESLIRRGKLDQGIALLKPLLDSDPRNLKALNLLGIALTQKGDLAAADRQFLQALQLDAKFYPALENLAANEFTLKDYDSSEKHFLEAAKFVPNDPALNSFLGKITFKRGEYARAAQYLGKSQALFAQEPALAVALVQSELETGKDAPALERLPQIPKTTPLRAQFQLALALATHEHYAEAIPYFEAVQKQHSDSYDAGFNLAICYVQTKAFSNAIDLLSALKSQGHNTAELNNLLAEAYEGANQLQPAIDALREATRLAPEDENNYIDLAALCSDHDALDLGLEIIEVGLHYRPGSDRLIFQRGILRALKNQFDLADQDFQLASKLAPERNLSYVGLSISYMQTGNLPEAIRTLRQRVAKKPADPKLQYLLGEALIRSGANPGDEAFAEAKAALEKSLSLSATFAPSRVDLAKLYLRENRVDEAVRLLEKARALDPQDKAAYSQLAIAYRRQGKPKDAAVVLSVLSRLNEEERQRESHAPTRLVKQDPASNP